VDDDVRWFAGAARLVRWGLGVRLSDEEQGVLVSVPWSMDPVGVRHVASTVEGLPGLVVAPGWRAAGSGERVVDATESVRQWLVAELALLRADCEDAGAVARFAGSEGERADGAAVSRFAARRV